ncbi:tetratricopeptide repeat protein, partial [Escherichia coli]|uniref:tetratricopeptide repeat protein n=1 Tax=Escherichia coli TaxID=562 RepID=UPI001C68A485
MKAKSTLLLMILSVFYSHQVLSSEPTQPDVYSVVEQKLNSALPLEENTTFRSQAEWFNLQYELLVSGYPERAYNLLSKLETESKNAKYHLDLTASRVAEEGAPETALTFLSKIGLNKPATLTSFESYINSWIKSKQPEKAMQLLSLDDNALHYYLPTVLVAYQSVPDKAISIYNTVYGDNVVIPYQQVTMLLTVAEGYQTKGDIKNTIHYADKALNMFDKAIAVDSSRESHYGDEYLKLMNIYAANGNKEKAVVLSQRLHKAITESQSNYLSTLEGILLFYRNNDMQQDYQNSLSNYIVFIDKIFAFSPSTRSELSLINLLNSLNEVELMKKRLVLLMTAPEYACYDSQYCYEDKVSALKILYSHQDNELMDKYFTTLLKEISNQPLEDWDLIISNTGEKLREGANKQVISSQADSLIKISRIWA